MKTIEEMIEVMKAYNEGKEIQCLFANCDEWEDDTNPRWDWILRDYRVKSEKQYRPYKDTEEMIDDYCERFHVTRTDYAEPFIWIKSKCGVKYFIEVITESNVWTVNNVVEMNDLFKKYTYKDGSPCGKEVE